MRFERLFGVLVATREAKGAPTRVAGAIVALDARSARRAAHGHRNATLLA
jgi:hypothetical protein